MRVKPLSLAEGDGTVKLFNALGFKWDREAIPQNVPVHSVDRVCFRFHKMLPEYVWDASMLEGNPFTFPEVQTLMDGVTVGGRKISDQEQVLNLIESSKQLLSAVKKGQYSTDKAFFTGMQGLIARNEALEWGHFRGEGDEKHFTPDVSLGALGRYTPLPTLSGAPELNRVFSNGLEQLQHCQPFEKGMAFFLFGALQQFFFDGNKRTSRMMMNGILMSAGIDAISIPAAQAKEFNEKMVRFYQSKNGTEMISLLVDCHPDAKLMRSMPLEMRHNDPEPGAHS